MKKTLAIIGILTLLILIALNVFKKGEVIDLKLEKLKQTYAVKRIHSVDHRKLTELQKEFNTPQEVTETCISCHTETPKEVMASAHWNWERAGYIEGHGIEFIGKKNAVNNYCIGSKSNEQACANCHIGFGKTD